MKTFSEVQRMNGKRCGNFCPQIGDEGPEPFLADIDRLAEKNCFYRTALWTGEHLQVTLMSIPAGGEIGLEIHGNLDQFLYIVEGCALVSMGECKEYMRYQRKAGRGCAVIVPACTWHNVVNVGCRPLKLFSLYAPPQHPYGTVHRTREEAADQKKSD